MCIECIIKMELFIEYGKYIETHPKLREIDPNDLPIELSISTMTGSCKFPVIFNIVNIAKYLPLSTEFIQGVKCGNAGEISRFITPIEKKKQPKINKSHKVSKPSKYSKNFYNQATIVINSQQQNILIKLNIKIFKNGAFQFTGCKKISYVVWALDNLLSILRKDKCFVENEITIKKSFAEPKCFLNLLSVTKFRISMINSNFSIGFAIDREKVFNRMTIDKYECSYDPSRHAGVHVKYYPNKVIPSEEVSDIEVKPLSIFIFDGGSIIITGARTYQHIMECYKFINIYLLEHYDEISQSGKVI